MLWMITFAGMEWEISTGIMLYVGSVFALTIAYWLLYSRMPRILSHNPSFNPGLVSIVVCARNEAENLKRNIPLWCDQVDVQVEVIVVDDHSTDHSAEVLKVLSSRFENLRWIESNGIMSVNLGKKSALTQGIRAAKGDVLLLTDADCTPLSMRWAAEMTTPFEDVEVGVVAGCAPVEPKGKSLLHRIQFADSLFTAMHYLANVVYRRPYMVVGRNVAYRKHAYPLEELIRQMKYISGDDDLVFQAVNSHWKTTAVLSPDAIVHSKGVQSWRTLWRQKRRHYAVSTNYNLRKSSIPGLFRVLQVLLLASGTVVVMQFGVAYILLSLLPWIMLMRLTKRWSRRMGVGNGVLMVLYEPLRYLFVVCVTISLIVIRPKKW